MKPALLIYDLSAAKRACIATHNALTAQPCEHGHSWQCPEVVERYGFITRSPAAATAMGQAVPDDASEVVFTKEG